MKMLGNIFILGDSYSTFSGYVPEGYDVYYSKNGPWYLESNPEIQPCDKDVHDVTQTWWYNLTQENGTLIRNCSWSGTTICHTGYDGADFSRKSFVTRIEKLIESGYFKSNKVDTLFLFGGTNDSWSNAPIGEPITKGWTKEDLYNVLPAFSYLMELLTKNLPETKIYCIINNELKDEISSFYKSTCQKYGVDTIELYDIEKISGHPTIEGMESIRTQILNYVKSH